jgi:hypothetical protein
MSAWVWVLVGAAAWLTLSLPLGVAVGAAIQRLSLDLSELLERGRWPSVPLRRDDEAAVATANQSETRKSLAGSMIAKT